MANAGLICSYDDTLCCFVFRKKTPWTVNQAGRETDLQQNNMLRLITYSSVMNNEKPLLRGPWRSHRLNAEQSDAGFSSN